MRYLYCLLMLSFLTTFVLPDAFSQDPKDKEIVVNGEKLIIHQVKPGETVFSLCKKYQISEQELKKFNPKLSRGLKTGIKIKIPQVKNNVNVISGNQQKEPSQFLTHEIKNQETPYFVSRKYGISIDDIYKYNPDLKKFTKGKKIRIPQWNISESVVSDNSKKGDTDRRIETFTDYVVKQGETLYSISRNQKVDITEILFYNPEARNLREGSILKLPRRNEFPEIKLTYIEKEIILHIIESGETLFGLTRKYNVSIRELTALNPDIEKNFPVGGVVKIPLNESYQKEIRDNAENPDLIKHIVLKGETLGSLAENRNLEVVEIKKFNPALNYRNLVEGETVFLPVIKKPALDIPANSANDLGKISQSAEKTGPVMRVPASCLPEKSEKNDIRTIRVAMLLPLFLDENEELFQKISSDTITAENTELLPKKDTISEPEPVKSANQGFFKNSENFLCFYEGALIALDSLRKSGIHVSLTVFDTRQDLSEIRKIIANENLKNINLIIGPVYPDQQEDIARFASKNRIPLISPLSSTSELIKSNSHFFQVNPSREYLYTETAEMVARDFSNCNFIVLKTGHYEKLPEGTLVDIINEKMTNTSYYNNNNPANFRIFDYKKYGSQGLGKILSPQTENVLLIATMDEGEISETLTDLKNLSSQFNITLIGNNRYPQLKSLNQEFFHILKLKYLSPYWINYNSTSTINFINNYRNLYKTEPNEFGYQGFDVTYFFCDVIGNYGMNFYNCLKYISNDLTQGKYYFEKVSEFGGYMNHGLSLISYEPDYSVVCKKIIGQPVLIKK